MARAPKMAAPGGAADDPADEAGIDDGAFLASTSLADQGPRARESAPHHPSIDKPRLINR